MNRNTWKQVASGLLAATLSLGIAACDDDTTSGGSTDMAVGNDMSAEVNDMTMGTPGNAQVTVADIVGSAWQGAMQIRRVHTLTALASFSKIAGTPDPSSDFALGPPPHGCSIYRYDLGGGKLPGSDADAGPVTITGYNLNTIGTDTRTGINAPPAMKITCGRGGPLMTYNCFFGGMPNVTDAGNAGMGALTSDIIFAPLPTANPANCPGSVLAAGPTGPFFCEQYPILRNFNSEITETVAGGADYAAPTPATHKFGSLSSDAGVAGFPDQLTVISVQSGTTEISGLDIVSGTIAPGTGGCPATSVNGCQRNLDLTDAMIDKTKPLTVSWSCDGTQTVGSGCTGPDFVGVLLTTSTNAKGTFSAPQSTKFGVGQCVETVSKSTHTATVSAAQLTALLGGQTGGSLQIALVRLAVGISPSGPHIVVYTAGHGQFGFTNLP